MTTESGAPRDRDRLIAVEGPDDRHVVSHIIQESVFQPHVVPTDYGGLDKLLVGIKGMIENPYADAIAIIVDADEHPDHRWQAVKSRLEQEGADGVPEQPEPNGTIIAGTDELPRIGIWMMPNNSTRGRLEDFVAKMIPGDDPVWPLSVAYIDGIPEDDREFKKQKEMGAKVRSWIATREKPGFMGEAIGRGDLSIDGDLCQIFIAWLDRLFDAEDEVAELA